MLRLAGMVDTPKHAVDYLNSGGQLVRASRLVTQASLSGSRRVARNAAPDGAITEDNFVDKFFKDAAAGAGSGPVDVGGHGGVHPAGLPLRRPGARALPDGLHGAPRRAAHRRVRARVAAAALGGPHRRRVLRGACVGRRAAHLGAHPRRGGLLGRQKGVAQGRAARAGGQHGGAQDAGRHRQGRPAEGADAAHVERVDVHGEPLLRPWVCRPLSRDLLQVPRHRQRERLAVARPLPARQLAPPHGRPPPRGGALPRARRADAAEVCAPRRPAGVLQPLAARRPLCA
mmetsp:Transcript_4607/g.14952  ORF Transcript_4607/g.14952 Transcript_4607/m.14952 type:complete len:287 (+) Transcript_4607:635-1495(+)